jgi:anaerobic magnesium-protoporphyrin IX monomethyl ester cyclase
MKILFIKPSSETPFKETISYPLGLLYMASILEKDNHKVIVKDYFDKSWEECKKEIIDLIRNYSPDIIGLNCWTMNRTACFQIAKISKKINPSCKIIMGGVHASSLYKQILENFPVDAVIIGEGELTMKELAKAWENKKSIRKIKGIALKEKNKVKFTGCREPIIDLDSLPFPKHEFCERTIRKNKTITMITSRGCPFGCIFCSTSAFWGRKWRARTAKNVADEIEYIKNRFPYVNTIFFEDDEFTVDKQRVIEICEEIIKRKIKINWQCSSRVDTVSEEILIKMKQAGCNEISYGIESGSKRILEVIEKKITLEKIENAIRLTEKAGLHYNQFLMVGNPGENWETVRETAKFIRRFKKMNLDSVGKLQIYPNTKIYEIAKKQGVINDSYWLTDKLVPIYTYEHSEEELTKMAYYIVAKNQLNRGVFNFLIFSIRFFFQKPKKAVKYLLKIILFKQKL